MGMDNVFGSSGNYSGFAKNVPLSFDDFIHKTVIDVNEHGTVAAAATASVGRGIDLNFNTPFEFHCRWPFFFTIQEREAKDILFAGIYRVPEATHSQASERPRNKEDKRMRKAMKNVDMKEKKNAKKAEETKGRNVYRLRHAF